MKKKTHRIKSNSKYFTGDFDGGIKRMRTEYWDCPDVMAVLHEVDKIHQFMRSRPRGRPKKVKED